MKVYLAYESFSHGEMILYAVNYTLMGAKQTEQFKPDGYPPEWVEVETGLWQRGYEGCIGEGCLGYFIREFEVQKTRINVEYV